MTMIFFLKIFFQGKMRPLSIINGRVQKQNPDPLITFQPLKLLSSIENEIKLRGLLVYGLKSSFEINSSSRKIRKCSSNELIGNNYVIINIQLVLFSSNIGNSAPSFRGHNESCCHIPLL